jgi:hypothetical protein
MVNTTGAVSSSSTTGTVRLWGQLFVNDGTLLLPANFHGDGDELYRMVP